MYNMEFYLKEEKYRRFPFYNSICCIQPILPAHAPSMWFLFIGSCGLLGASLRHSFAKTTLRFADPLPSG